MKSILFLLFLSVIYSHIDLPFKKTFVSPIDRKYSKLRSMIADQYEDLIYKKLGSGTINIDLESFYGIAYLAPIFVGSSAIREN